MRHIFVAVFALGSLLATALPVSAQGFGLGARFAWVTQDVEVDADSVRFFGVHMRATGGRTGFELSFDRHTEEFELINEKVIETPIQASLIMRLASGSFAPYLLGGPGWYKRTIEPIDGPEDSGESEHRVRLARRRRPGDPRRSARRHPRRLSVHVPRLRRRRRR